MAFTFIENWKKKRLERKQEQQRLANLFVQFLAETRPLTPKASKFKEAALYRHAWKRAAILALLFKDIPNSEREYLYTNFAKMASRKYYAIAPENLYGKVQLKISPEAISNLLEKEKKILFPEPNVSTRRRDLACIYLGVDDQGKHYVGQTIDAPEYRWVQHRASGTGPFKDGATYVKWEVLERNVQPSELNYKEAYYIGLYNSLKNGFNDNRGYDLEAYEKGLANMQGMQ